MDKKSGKRIRIPKHILHNPRKYNLQSLWAAGRALVSVLPHVLIDVPEWGKAQRTPGQRMISTMLILSSDDWAWADKMSQDWNIPPSVFLRGIIVAGYKALYTPEAISPTSYSPPKEHPSPESVSPSNLTPLTERIHLE